MKDIFKDLPQWSKGVIAVIAVGGVALIGYTVYKKISKTQQTKDAEESLRDVNKDIITLSKTQKPSFIQAQYGAFGDSLFEAMSGFGTDNSAIEEIFGKMKNTLDVLKLVQAFGIRIYSDDRLFFFNTKEMNLNQWISAELSNNEKNKLNKVLASKGIKYQF
jgi:hypothetical protein